MDFYTYTQNATRTESNDFPAIAERLADPNLIRLLHAVIGMNTEIVELTVATDDINRLEEIGDFLWYAAIAGDVLDHRELSYTIGKETPSPESISYSIKQLAQYVGEMQDHLKKTIFYGKPLARGVLVDLLDSALYWCQYITHDSGSTLAAVMEKNIAKLKARYGEKFSNERANQRDLNTERQILETT